MKYLQDDRLSNIACRLLSSSSGGIATQHQHHLGGDGGVLSGHEQSGGTARWYHDGSSQRRLHGRIEAYTTKRAGNDKKYAAEFSRKYVEWQESYENELARSELQNQRQPTAGGFGAAGAAGVRETLLERAFHSAPSSTTFSYDAAVAAAASSSPSVPLTRKKRSHSEGGSILEEQQRKRQQQQQALKSQLTRRSRSHSYDAADVLAAMNATTTNITTLGDLRDLGVRRLMTDFILTLNMSFPDYDFGDEVTPNDFHRVPMSKAYSHIQSQLLGTNIGTCLVETTTSPSSTAPIGELGGLQDAVQSTPTQLGTIPEKGDATGEKADDPASGGVASMTPCQHSQYQQQQQQPLQPSSSHHQPSSLLSELWSALDHVISLADCEVYQWTNHDHDDILLEEEIADEQAAAAAGTMMDDGDALVDTTGPNVLLWSFYYFFVNKTLKRIVFFACCESMSTQQQPQPADVEDEDVVFDLEADSRHPHRVRNGQQHLQQLKYISRRSSMESNSSTTNAGSGDGGVGGGGGGSTPGDVELVSEGEEHDDDEDEEDEEEDEERRYNAAVESVDAGNVDFDLDPSAVAAGGIPISTV